MVDGPGLKSLLCDLGSGTELPELHLLISKLIILIIPSSQGRGDSEWGGACKALFGLRSVLSKCQPLGGVVE